MQHAACGMGCAMPHRTAPHPTPLACSPASIRARAHLPHSILIQVVPHLDQRHDLQAGRAAGGQAGQAGQAPPAGLTYRRATQDPCQ